MNNLFNKNLFWDSALPIKNDILLNVSTCLVMVPHPDDESLGCAGLIMTLLNLGKKVELILTTDGSRSHPNSKKYPSEKLSALRLNELHQAMKLMGINENHLRCYNSRDAEMPGKGAHGFENLQLKLIDDLQQIAPDLILVPYELDPHCDHRSTFQLLIAALERAGINRPIIWEYPIWLYYNAAAADLPSLTIGEVLSLDISDYLDIKSKCIQAHGSQTSGLIDDDPEGFMLSQEVIATFLSGKEYFLQRSKNNPNITLSGEYFEQMYHQNPDPWNFETSVYEKQKYQQTLQALNKGRYDRALEIGCSIGVLTEMLSVQCSELIAMDISDTALQIARRRLSEKQQVRFINQAIPEYFPEGPFDLIVLSEVGYYLNQPDLLKARDKMINLLSTNGTILLVHWTHFVADYPLTGDQVHECFLDSSLSHIYSKRMSDYRIDLLIRD